MVLDGTIPQCQRFDAWKAPDSSTQELAEGCHGSSVFTSLTRSSSVFTSLTRKKTKREVKLSALGRLLKRCHHGSLVQPFGIPGIKDEKDTDRVYEMSAPFLAQRLNLTLYLEFNQVWKELVVAKILYLRQIKGHIRIQIQGKGGVVQMNDTSLGIRDMTDYSIKTFPRLHICVRIGSVQVYIPAIVVRRIPMNQNAALLHACSELITSLFVCLHKDVAVLLSHPTSLLYRTWMDVSIMYASVNGFENMSTMIKLPRDWKKSLGGFLVTKEERAYNTLTLAHKALYAECPAVLRNMEYINVLRAQVRHFCTAVPSLNQNELVWRNNGNALIETWYNPQQGKNVIWDNIFSLILNLEHRASSEGMTQILKDMSSKNQKILFPAAALDEFHHTFWGIYFSQKGGHQEFERGLHIQHAKSWLYTHYIHWLNHDSQYHEELKPTSDNYFRFIPPLS